MLPESLKQFCRGRRSRIGSHGVFRLAQKRLVATPKHRLRRLHVSLQDSFLLDVRYVLVFLLFVAGKTIIYLRLGYYDLARSKVGSKRPYASGPIYAEFPVSIVTMNSPRGLRMPIFLDDAVSVALGNSFTLTTLRATGLILGGRERSSF